MGSGIKARGGSSGLWEQDSSEDDAHYSYREKKLDQLENPWAASAEPETKPTAKGKFAHLPPRMSSLPTPPPGSPERSSLPSVIADDPWTAKAEGIDELYGDNGTVQDPGSIAESGATNRQPTLSSPPNSFFAGESMLGGTDLLMNSTSSPTSATAPDDPWDLLVSASNNQDSSTESRVVASVGNEDDLLAFLSGPSSPVQNTRSKLKSSGLEDSASLGPVDLSVLQDPILTAATAAEPSSPSHRGPLDEEKEKLIRQVLELQKSLQAKLKRTTTAKTDYHKQHSETLLLHQYMTNLMMTSRKLEKETEQVKPEKSAKKSRRWLFR
ncbi:hypothetical protein DFJ77DRAFT_510516 [Powellomyces hirtus]|nr:hypothetical protein DFJ77DRAFT_510516 [Powellomyces hirtus]